VCGVFGFEMKRGALKLNTTAVARIRVGNSVGPLIAGTLIVSLGGYGPAATIVGLFFILGLVAAPFLPETNGKPLPETLSPPQRLGADPQRQTA
jgi:hypothetical protein